MISASQNNARIANRATSLAGASRLSVALLAFGCLSAAAAVYANESAASYATEEAAPAAAPRQAAPQMIATDFSLTAPPPIASTMLEQYCWQCHNDFDQTANLSVDALTLGDLHSGENAAQWEKILRRISSGEMPPSDKDQPDAAERAQFVNWLENARASFRAANPDPGTATFRRLNRAEYANAVRDLLALDIDFTEELPRDNSGFGFDNIADVLTVSPTLMERYVAVAGKVGRLATGLSPQREVAVIYQVPKDGSVKNSGVPAFNERAHPLLPLASRGGWAVHYYAPHDGEYDISAWLNSNTNNETDRERDDLYTVRIPLKAGAREIGLAFRRERAPLEAVQTLRNNIDYVPLPLNEPVMLPLDVWLDGERLSTVEVPSFRMHARYSQQNFPRDILQIDVTGPFVAQGRPDTPSTRAIFTCDPVGAAQEATCATAILTRLARRAWRRSVTASDIVPLLAIYQQERDASGFQHGISAAVEALLVSPQFLFAVERVPDRAFPGAIYELSDHELATRLALFLWSSIPDDELLDLADARALSNQAVLEAQVTRMLADPKASALTQNFAGQWLYLRNLAEQRPDIEVFPDFDKRLQRAMASETEMFFEYVLRANRPVLDFITSDYTFLNERLAAHYGIPGVEGTAFRKVDLVPEWRRGGLLGQGSILTVTSFNNHTSVVKRGKWILDNILAAAPPPPPPDIPTLEQVVDGRKLTAREQLERHSSDPACASCHKRMDPLGYALENFDAVGAWREIDAGKPIDTSAIMPDGSPFAGIEGLQGILMARRIEFAQALTDRLMTYALARGLEANDMPLVRAIAADAAADDYRFHTIIRGIVTSDAFRTRKVPGTLQTAQTPFKQKVHLP